MTRLIVENVHRTSSRRWAFVTGRLEGNELHIGDELTITHSNAQVATAVVRSIELHSAQGKTTIAVDAALADTIQSGTVLAQPSAAVQFLVNEVFDIATRGGLLAVGTTRNGEFIGIPTLRDDASGHPVHVLGVDHPTPRTQRTGETILVVGRADADYVQPGRLWTQD